MSTGTYSVGSDGLNPITISNGGDNSSIFGDAATYPSANLQPLSPDQLQPGSSFTSGIDAISSGPPPSLPQFTAGPAPSSPSPFGGASGLLGDAALLGAGYYGISQAKAAQSQINGELGPLRGQANSMFNESNALMRQYQSGQLPAWAQGVLNPISGESQTLLNDYNSGRLNPAEQNYANEINGQGQNLMSMYDRGQINPAEQGFVNQINGQANTDLSRYNAGQLNPGEQSYADQLRATGSNLLAQYASGTLPQWASSYVDWTSQQATDLLTSDPQKALNTLATQNFTDYNSGKLKPADETQLDQQVQQQKQQVMAQLAASGMGVDSSVAAAQFQAIDNQAAITRQNILNSYFQTGDQAYNQWLSANAQASQVKAQGAQFANNVFSTMLSEGLSAVTSAAQYTQAGLTQEEQAGMQAKQYAAGYEANALQSELQAGQQAEQYAAGYTQSGLNAELSAGMQGKEFVAGETGTVMNNTLTGAEQTATIGSQDMTQAIGIQLQSDNQLSQSVGNLMQSLAAMYAYSRYPGASGGGGGGGGGSIGGAVANMALNDVVGGAISKLGGLFSAAGGGAAAAALPAGMSAAVGSGATAAELGAGAGAVSTPISVGGGAAASGAGAGAAGAGSLAGAAAGLGIVGGIAALGLMTPAVSIPQSYWNNLNQTVAAGKAKGYTQSNPIVDGNGVVDPGWAAWNNALQELQTGSNQPSNGGERDFLNSLGYQEYSQMTPHPLGPQGSGGGGSVGRGVARS